jgi:putative NADH-flavin reductase
VLSPRSDQRPVKTSETRATPSRIGRSMTREERIEVLEQDVAELHRIVDALLEGMRAVFGREGVDLPERAQLTARSVSDAWLAVLDEVAKAAERPRLTLVGGREA